jgi:putative membrane protein
MKNGSTLCVVFICLILAVACNNSLSVNSNSTLPKQVISSYDKDLLTSVFEECIYTTKLAEEAMMRSTSADTKTFATNLISDYKKMMQQIEGVAGSKSIDLPLDMGDKQLKKWRQMVKETGWNFDKKFVELATEGNNETAALVKNISATAKDDDIRKTAANILSYTNQQDMADQVQQTIKSRTEKDSFIKSAIIIEP